MKFSPCWMVADRNRQMHFRLEGMGEQILERGSRFNGETLYWERLG